MTIAAFSAIVGLSAMLLFMLWLMAVLFCQWWIDGMDMDQ